MLEPSYRFAAEASPRGGPDDTSNASQDEEGYGWRSTSVGHTRRAVAVGENHPSPQVVLVRHGETEWSRDGRHTGRTDVPLTRVGRGAGAVLANRLRAWRFSRILTSPLRRAFDTCQLAGYGGTAQVRDKLREWDYGVYEGRTTADIRSERPGWILWTDGAPGGETAGEVGARVDPLVTELRTARGHVAIFGHGHLLRVLTARWIELAPAEGRRFALGTATISVLGFERETPVILRWNQDGRSDWPAAP